MFILSFQVFGITSDSGSMLSIYDWQPFEKKPIIYERKGWNSKIETAAHIDKLC